MTRVPLDAIARLRQSGTFDVDWYLQTYPDVAQCGMDPAEHFLWLGARLGRRPGPDASIGMAAVDLEFIPGASVGTRALDVLFIDGTNGTSSTPYRVTRIADGLEAEGWTVKCIDRDDIPLLDEASMRPRFAMFFRSPFWEPCIELVARLKANGTIIGFDIDDLVFDESIIPYIDGYKELNEADQAAFMNGVSAYRTFIMNVDFCTAATSFLVDEMKKLGKPAYRVRNAISSQNIEFFEKVDIKRKGRPKPFIIGYYSGTKTHQADFAVAGPALIRFMTENPEVVFRLAGEFDLAQWPELDRWQHVFTSSDVRRVTKVGLMPHDVMIRDHLICDLVIAPLEVGNPFCESKSELKFFEASLAKCPVIASATRTFVEATDNGRLADVATTTDDWYQAFTSTYNNYGYALKRAQHAFDEVRKVYSQRFAANEALDAYKHFASGSLIPLSEIAASDETAGNDADIAVLLPDFTGPSGGHRKIFTICQALEAAGHSLKLYFYTGREPKVIKRDIARFFGELKAPVAAYRGHVGSHSKVICTQWKTTYDARWLKFDGDIIVFMQDYEPLFYPAGSDHLRALIASRLGFDVVCYGHWVAAKLKDELGVGSKVIPFGLDHAIYAPPAVEPYRDIDILVYARPSQDRRCFDLIAEGLAKLKQQRPEIRICLFGENEYEDFGFEFTNFGSIVRLEELAKLYHRTKLGICFSPTNPSQLGYEMLACGANLIDVRIKFSELNFSGEEFVAYTDGSPEDLCGTCISLLDDEADRRQRQSMGYRFIQAMPAEDRLGAAFMDAIDLSPKKARFGKSWAKG